jgi:uncharacterized LabA/DUF88 family protein
MKPRCIILIDGSNFYFKLKGVGVHKLLSFDFHRFAQLLGRAHEIVGTNYYVGRVRQDGTRKAQELFDGQQKLLGHLKNQKVRYILGYLLKSDGVFHEKGVDVQIAVDMLVASYENMCDRIILVSSDTDLAPAIKKVQEQGKVVEYVGFSNKPSVAMVSFCRESRLLTKDDIQPLISS